MAFPTTGVLEDFNRPDGAVGANWTTPVYIDSTTLKIVGNRCTFDPAGGGGGYYNAVGSGGDVGPDCEVYATVAVTGADNFSSYFRISSPGAAANGYTINWLFFSNICRAFRIDAGVKTQLGANVAAPFADGDQAGSDIVGSTLTFYKNGVALDTRSDATYSAAGKIGVLSFSTTTILDDFGGGTVLTGPPPPPPELIGQPAVSYQLAQPHIGFGPF